MPVQAFVDDSGGKGQGRYFVLAGLVAHSDHWAQFSDEWQACLDRDPSISFFKMREAANCSGQFYGMSEKQRDDKLLELAKIINRGEKFGIISAIDLEAHAETWAVWNSKPVNEPYFFPFHTMILAACFTLSDMKWTEQFEIIFDEHVIFGPRARSWYPVVRDIVKSREPEAYEIMPVDPVFRSDTKLLPNQTCDMVAWMNRRSRQSGCPFMWLAEEIRNVQVSEYSAFYDRERIENIRKMEDGMLRDGSIPIELLAHRYKQYFGDK